MVYTFMSKMQNITIYKTITAQNDNDDTKQ